ncbi:MAG: hypothetical protein JJ911_12705 [Rhizobiaceae bacterium]|nr:hypothetical protein [Rhizobiaceae bacterium]
MHTANTNFRQSALITAARITADAEEALRLAPEGITVPEGLNAYQQGLLYELNRFPGTPSFAFVPEGPNREAMLSNVEDRARAYEAEHPRGLTEVPGYYTITIYLKNIRELFVAADVDDGRPLPSENPLTVDVPSTLDFLTEPKNAIKFALERLEAFEVPAFLRDWQQGLNLRGWLEGLNADQEAAVDLYETKPSAIQY